MIETAVKRNGNIEPFSVEKINDWWMWTTEQHDIAPGEGSEAIQRAILSLPKQCTTEQIQRSLINELVALKRWKPIMMAGTLEASLLHKNMFPKGIPTVEEQFKKMALIGRMIHFNFTDREWMEINKIIDHDRDYHMPQFSIKYIMGSYALSNSATKEKLETPQFTYMRMAATVAAPYPQETRLEVLKELYEMLSNKIISAPTPNFTNLGTPNNGLASCCLYTADDDRRSLAAASLISYVQTYSSSGLGYHQAVRSVGDPVRGGSIEHQGEQWYLRHNAAAAAANRQSKRGGAITAYISAYSKEAKHILAAREPTAPVGTALIGIDISLSLTKDFISRAIGRSPALSFTKWSDPELYELMFSGDPKRFEEAMKVTIENNTDKSREINPREVMGTLGRVTISTGRNFAFFPENANRHTPLNEPIFSSNLCCEIMEHTAPYKDYMDLNREDDDVEGEVAMCNLAAVNHAKVADDPELHRRACIASLRMVDYCIENGYYELKHVGYTAKKRRYAGVGVMNTASYMARNNLKYDSKEGMEHMHDFAERHMYYLIEASLQLGKEFGNAPWIDRTKWVGYTDKEGNKISAWMPIDTQNKKAAKELGLEPKQDWEDLRSRVAENGGIRNSLLCAYMPGESSSKALGGANSIYPVRDLVLDKTDSTLSVDWCAEGAGDEEYNYQSAYSLSTTSTIKFYAIWQMWCDQGISADFWLPFVKGANVIEIDSVLKKYAEMYAYGLKSHYYTVPMTQKSTQEKNNDHNEMKERVGKIVKLKMPQKPYPEIDNQYDLVHDARAVSAVDDAWSNSNTDDDRAYSDGPVCASDTCSL